MKKTIGNSIDARKIEAHREFERKLLSAKLTKREIFLLLLKIKQITGDKV